jgi:hypothetical protein
MKSNEQVGNLDVAIGEEIEVKMQYQEKEMQIKYKIAI